MVTRSEVKVGGQGQVVRGVKVGGSRSGVKVWGGVKVWAQGRGQCCGQGRGSRSGVEVVGSWSGHDWWSQGLGSRSGGQC